MITFYLVGGAVRDMLLNLPVKDKDWVVVGATPQKLLEQGFKPVGQDFPVFLHPKTKEEYALARTERKSGHGYTGFSFYAKKDVTLEQDLSRRDLTINAIAQSDNGDIIDPHNGQQDLKNKLLRHVSPAFKEDPVRVLRIARFSARYHHLGFSIAPSTLLLMKEMVTHGELNHLVAERVWQEMHSALGEKNPDIFFKVLRQCGALRVLLPEINALFGVPQPKAHHPEIDTGVHTLLTLHAASKISQSKAVRFAALLHDLGKALTPKETWPAHHGHEQLGIAAVNTLCERLKAPNDFTQLARIVCEYHTHCHRAFELTSKTVLKLFKNTDAFRRPQRFHNFLLCTIACARGRTGLENTPYPQADLLATYLCAAQTIQAKNILKNQPELKGPKIGEAIYRAQLNAIEKIKTGL